MILLYIDPGTGSMLFTILIGILSSLLFVFRKLFIRLKFTFSAGRDSRLASKQYPFVIFSDSKRYWNVFKPVCDEFERRCIELIYWTASPDDPALAAGYKYVTCSFIGEGNKAFAKLNTLNADVVLSTTPGLDVYQWKRSKGVKYYVHIFHAVDEALGYRMFGMDYYDAVLLTGQFQGENIRKLEKLRSLPEKELRVTGCTYMDELYERHMNTPEPAHEKTVLIAPSWGKSAILNRFGSALIEALLETDYRIIIRPHPQSAVSEKEMLDELMQRFPDNERLCWSFDNNNFDAMNRSDVMITDFSGIIFDYSLVFGKPILYADTSFDRSPYDAAWIDEPLWRFEVLPELGKPLDAKDFPSIQQLLDDLIANPSFAEGRRKVTGQAWQKIGQSAVLTVDYLIEKQKQTEDNCYGEPAI